MYALEYTPAVRRQIAKLQARIHKEDFERLAMVIRALATEPRPHRSIKIKGEEGAYRIRVGDYRVIYDVHDSERRVLLLQVARRDEATYRVREVPGNYDE